jgi:hypothetical protein
MLEREASAERQAQSCWSATLQPSVERRRNNALENSPRLLYT